MQLHIPHTLKPCNTNTLTTHRTGGKMSAAEVEDLQRMAAGITAIAERRAAFLALFLEPLA